jgi:hypothetical protein
MAEEGGERMLTGEVAQQEIDSIFDAASKGGEPSASFVLAS